MAVDKFLLIANRCINQLKTLPPNEQKLAVNIIETRLDSLSKQADLPLGKEVVRTDAAVAQ